MGEGAFGNIENNPLRQKIHFAQPYTAPYLRFTSLANVQGDAPLAVAEIG